MRIAYFITHFPYQNRLSEAGYLRRYMHGGAEIASYYLAKEMAHRGHEVKVFTTSIDSSPAFLEEEGIKIYRCGTNFRIERGNVSFTLFTKPLQHEVDIIHANFSTPPAELAALMYSKRRNIPFVLTYHGDWQENFGRPYSRVAMFLYNRLILHWLLSQTRVIICHSEYYPDESRFLGKYKDKIAIVPSGIDITQFDIPLSREECRAKLALPQETSIVLYLGNLTPYKGPEVLLKAMPHIASSISQAILLFVGGGILRSQLEQLAAKLDITKSVRFAGFVEEELKPLYYRAADIFVLPSTMNTEVFPRVLLEASAAGLPMVVSSLSTFRCIIEDGCNGVITKTGDEEDVARAIIQVLQSQTLKAQMAQNARKKVNDYAWDKIAAQNEAVYEELLKS